MQVFLNQLREIYENGVDHPDRTGDGRRSLFGVDLRFDLRGNILPLVTTRKVFHRGIIRELIWFLSGSTNARELQKDDVKIWDQWTVEPEHVDAFIEKHFSQFEGVDADVFRTTLLQYHEGSIGNLYGRAWRYAPNTYNALQPSYPVEHIASDKLKAFELLHAKMQEKKHGQEMDFVDFANYSAGQIVDQMQNLLVNLKLRPYSSRHCVTTWIPEFIPFEELSPQENVLLGKASLAPCHVFQQYFVTPPKNPGDKPRLSLKMTQR